MRTVHGTPRFDSVYLGEVKVELVNFPQVHMTVVAGYADSKTNQRYGSLTLLGGWRPETLAKLGEFLDALEQDVASLVFEGVSTTGGGADTAEPTSDGIPQL